MKTVLILFEEQEWSAQMDMLHAKYLPSYEALYTAATEKGVRLCRASVSWFDKKNGHFEYAWAFEEGEWIALTNITPDLVFDKTPSEDLLGLWPQVDEIAQRYTIVNDPHFSALLDNKMYTHMLFPQFTKRSILADSASSLRAAIDRCEGDRIVVKPLMGSQGEGVEILQRERARSVEVEGTMLVQEFIDGSKGIPHIVDGVHDLRLMYINDELVYSYVRTPVAGSLIANIAQGGTKTIIEPDTLPQSLQPLVELVQQKLSVYPHRLYSLDVMFDQEQRPWIVELGAKPGMFFDESQRAWQGHVHGAVIAFFQSILDS